MTPGTFFATLASDFSNEVAMVQQVRYRKRIGNTLRPPSRDTDFIDIVSKLMSQVHTYPCANSTSNPAGTSPCKSHTLIINGLAMTAKLAKLDFSFLLTKIQILDGRVLGSSNSGLVMFLSNATCGSKYS